VTGRQTWIAALATGAALATAAPAAAMEPGHAMAAPGAAAVPGMGAADGGARSTDSIGFDAYAPSHLDVVTGDTVTWTNDSVRAHTVTAEDGGFDSGRLAGGATFSHAFDAAGDVAFYCTLHPGMRGDVAVRDLLLEAPSQPAGPGRAFPLRGRSALAQGTEVTITADDGTGPVPAGQALVGADGGFATTVVPRTTATYQASAGDTASPPVQLVVLDHHVAARVVRGRHGAARVVADVTPAAAGSTVVLQLRLRDRFGWWPVQRHRLDRRSHTSFRLRLRRGVPVRVLLTLPDGATVLGSSGTLARKR
jgi:plastocyanin